jgi:hypothetical protein
MQIAYIESNSDGKFLVTVHIDGKITTKKAFPQHKDALNLATRLLAGMGVISDSSRMGEDFPAYKTARDHYAVILGVLTAAASKLATTSSPDVLYMDAAD